MDTSQKLLFGGFPRTMGVTTPERESSELTQYVVHSQAEFDGVVDAANGERNLYASISRFLPGTNNGEYAGNAIEIDKVSFDFDSSAKAEPNSEHEWLHPLLPKKASDAKIWKLVKTDRDIRDAVLGDVCSDVQRLADRCMEDNVPLIGVFSGFGIHCHMLYQRTRKKITQKMKSTYNKWISQNTLSTTDDRASGKPFRILRIPNVRRVDNSKGCTKLGYTVPLRHDELMDITPTDLTDYSESPRINVGIDSEERPELQVEKDFLQAEGSELGQAKMRSIPDVEVSDDFAHTIVKEITGMPCVYERAFGVDPPNDIRVKVGIMFLNAGFSPDEITNIISKLGWVNFDRETTKYQLKKLKESGRGDWSCRTMRGKGLCTRADNKHDCPMFGYHGGNTP